MDDPWRIGGGGESEAAALRGRGEEGTWWANELNPLGAQGRKRGRGGEEEEEEKEEEEKEEPGVNNDQPQEQAEDLPPAGGATPSCLGTHCSGCSV